MVSNGEAADSGIGMLMNLRKCANHPLLIRDHYDLHKLEVMARLLKTRDSGHKQAIESYIVEDLKIMSDFEINKTCETYRVRHPPSRLLGAEFYVSVHRAFVSWKPSDLRLRQVQNAGRNPARYAEQRGQSTHILPVHHDDGCHGEISENSGSQVTEYNL